MATYAIGDVQGCTRTLELLIERIGFRAHSDHVILCGDLVNRGPSSLAALRWAHAHQDSLTLVLGNHDVALLAYAAGVRPLRAKDTFAPIMQAHDKDVLLQWLATRPWAHKHQESLVLHAGVLPSWGVQDILSQAQKAQNALQGPDSGQFLAALETHAEVPHHLDDAVHAARVLTYLRALGPSGSPDFTFKGPRSALLAGAMPWFAAPGRCSQDTTIICGHWAALGLYLGDNIRALDTGCVWGGLLTAYCLETQEIIQMPYSETTQPLATQSD